MPMVSEERLQSIDEELAQLGKSDDEVAAIAARFGGADLAEVDRELEALAADREGMDAILALARAAVPSALSAATPKPRPPATAEAADEPREPDLDTFQGSAELAELISAAEAGDSRSRGEGAAVLEAVAAAGEAPEGDGGLDALMAELEAEEAAELEAEGGADLADAPPSPSPDLDAVLDGAQAEAAPLGARDAQDLFGDADPFAGDEEPAATGDLSDLFAADELAAAVEEEVPGTLSETLEADGAPPEGPGAEDFAPIGAGGPEDEDDETYVFSMNHIAGIGGEGAPPATARDPLDDDLDAMLAADIVGAGEPAAEAASAQVVNEFELLVDEEMFLVEEDGIVEEVEKAEPTDLQPTDDPYAAASIFDDVSEPNLNYIDVEAAVPEQKTEEGAEDAEDDGAEKKGFFKKLFGKD